jgi:predicted nucleotidyltransferase component of viral defense system
VKHTREAIGAIARASGFRPEHVEKVLWLIDLLDGLVRHPFLEGKLALKGGTALNLFHYPLPRLSVDIDLNYVGSPKREEMLRDRPAIEKAIEGVCQRTGIAVARKPEQHSGGKWSLRYPSVLTVGGNLELDLNYLQRVPLWPVGLLGSMALGDHWCEAFPVLDLHELAAGKLAALFDRSAPRDVFDAAQLLADPRINREKLRVGFVAYGAMSRRDWRTVSEADIRNTEEGYRNEVAVLLRTSAEAGTSAGELQQRCRRAALDLLLPLNDNETEFLRAINEEGSIRPELITSDEQLGGRIAIHPALQWKAANVRKHRGLSEDMGGT